MKIILINFFVFEKKTIKPETNKKKKKKKGSASKILYSQRNFTIISNELQKNTIDKKKSCDFRFVFVF